MLPHLSVGKFIHLAYKSVEELTVVTHDNRRSVKSLDSFLQHIFRRHVEMVGRLVEDKEVDRREQQAYHSQPAALTATEHLHPFLRGLAAKHKRTEDIVDL